MRACHVMPAYPADEVGYFGCIFFRPMFEWLADAGVTCTGLTGLTDARHPREQREGTLLVKRFAFGDHEPRRGLSSTKAVRAVRYLAAAIPAIRSMYADHPFELLHAHSPLPCGLAAVLAARRLKVPVVLTLHGSDLFIYAGKSRLNAAATRWILRRVRVIVATSEQMAEVAQEFAPHARIEHIPLGYNDKVFRAGRLAEQREQLIVSTRTLAPLYDVETLVRAAVDYGAASSAEVIIHSDGPERARLEAMAAGSTLRFAGFAQPPVLAEVLERAAVYVSTSTSDTSSISLREAMACGAYPIVSDIRANRAWIDDGVNGRLFPVGDARALAAAIADALPDAAARARAATLNAERVRRAAWSTVAPQLCDVYAAAVGG